MKRLLLLYIPVCLILSGCRTDREKKISIDLEFESLEDSLPKITTKTQLVTFLTRHSTLRDHFFKRSEYPNDSVYINDLFARFTNPHLDTLLDETHHVFGDLTGLKEEFRLAFTNMTYYYPDFKPPKIQTMVGGFETDLWVSDTLVIVGLDYFLGPGAKYRPPNMYEYMLRRFRKDFIVPSYLLLNGIDSHFNKTTLTDKTVLGDMIAYGKAYYFAKQMLPTVADSIFIGYTGEEMALAEQNEDIIYARLIDNEVIYSTSHEIKQRYLEERPFTPEVGEKCPGRIATWVGWQIVKAYADNHPDKSLLEIMRMEDPEKLFKDSRYRPEKK